MTTEERIKWQLERPHTTKRVTLHKKKDYSKKKDGKRKLHISPAIKISGKWLEKYGFAPGYCATVTVEYGKITIT
jgi:hypothetical protein